MNLIILILFLLVLGLIRLSASYLLSPTPLIESIEFDLDSDFVKSPFGDNLLICEESNGSDCKLLK